MATPIRHRCGSCGCITPDDHHIVDGVIYCQNWQCWGLPPCDVVKHEFGNLLSGKDQVKAGFSQQKSEHEKG